MLRVGFEPTIPVFEKAKMVHALDRAFTVISYILYYCPLNMSGLNKHVMKSKEKY
jgi:hypothetical protein